MLISDDQHLGTLKITLLGGSNLKSADANGLSDPFCVLSVSSLYTLQNQSSGASKNNTIQSRTSSIVKRNLNPVWNQVFSFPVGSRDQTIVEFKVFDYDKDTDNDLLGHARFYCKLLNDFIEAEVRLELDTQGSVDVQFLYYPGNEYGNIMKRCIENKQHYVDQDFSAITTSICRSRHFLAGRHIEQKDVVWMRPKEYCAKAKIELPQLFLDGIEPSDIKQQILGDCYFLAALAALAMQPKQIMKLISPSSYNEFGAYQVNFFWEGNTQSVVVDDLIPVHVTSDSINTLFARSTSLRELWVCILEKAYAKLHGNYENIEGAHHIGEAFEHLTGGFAHNFDLKNESQQLFKQMLEWRKFKYPMVCCTSNSEDLNFEGKQKMTLYGIIPKHAYTVLDVKLVDDIKFVKLRNTWGKSEWKGKYADDDSAWTDKLRKKLKVERANDGVFFMEFSDFVTHFNRLHVCSVPMDTFISPAIRSEWNKVNLTCGGLFDESDKDVFCRNPQFALSVIGDRTVDFSGDYIRVLISAQLEDTSKTNSKDSKERNPICIYVVKPNKPMDNTKPLLRFNDMTIVGKSYTLQTTRNCVEVLIPKPQDNVQDNYFVILSMFHPGREASFIARCFSDWENTKFVELDMKRNYALTKIIGSWKENAFNGPHYQPTTFETNPKFLIQLVDDPNRNLPDQTTLQVRCKVREANVAFFPYIVSLSQFKKYKNSGTYAPLVAKNCVLFPDAKNTFYSQEKIFSCQLKKAQKNWILIMCTPFKTTSKFILEFLCEYPIEISNLE